MIRFIRNVFLIGLISGLMFFGCLLNGCEMNTKVLNEYKGQIIDYPNAKVNYEVEFYTESEMTEEPGEQIYLNDMYSGNWYKIKVTKNGGYWHKGVLVYKIFERSN